VPDPQATDASTRPPPAAPPTAPAPPAPIHTPRAGELTTGWRIVVACTWIAVIVAFAAVWNTSVQLGLSTWWLGARADPQSPIVRLSPFLAPLLMAIAAFANARWLALLGVGAAAVTAVFGIADLGRVPGLATLELIIAGVALAVSLASLTGTYRSARSVPGADDLT
jgi:hypothetical protein